MKSLPALQTGLLLQNGHAGLFDRAGINRRFVNDDVAFLQNLSDRARSRMHGPKVRPVDLIDRRRHGNDIKIRGRKVLRLARDAQIGIFQILRIDFARAVAVSAQVFNARRIDVETDDGDAGPCKGRRHGKADMPSPITAILRLCAKLNSPSPARPV